MHPDSEIIDLLGGTTAVAKLCEIKAGSVSEWRRKGIPRARVLYLRVIRPDAFGVAVETAPTLSALMIEGDDTVGITDRRRTDRRASDRRQLPPDAADDGQAA